MKDHRYVDELSVEELEAILRLRRREERLRRLENQPRAVDPLVREVPVLPRERGVAPEVADRHSSSVEIGRYSAVFDAPPKHRISRPIKWRWVRDQVLLFVEILAILALLGVVAMLTVRVGEINEESRALQAMPTPTPTPIIQVSILPGGHTPPDENRVSQPVPVHLRDHVAPVTPIPVPTRGPEHARRVRIPAIEVDAPVVLATPLDDWEALKRGAVHYITTANPGERGNSVFAAHNDIYGEIFRRLPDLTVGDEVIVQTASTAYRYAVEQTRIVSPKEVSVMDPTSTPVLTLISCYPYGVNTHRIVVIASLIPD